MTHLYGKYGENWQNYVRIVSPSGSLTKHKDVKLDIAPDIHGIFPTIGNITYNRTRYMVYDSPHDGSYMYHSVSAVLQLIMREYTPSAEGLKAALQVFYSQRGQLQQNMERLLAISFKDKLKDVSWEDHWGEFTDAFSLATIYSIQMKVTRQKILE